MTRWNQSYCCCRGRVKRDWGADKSPAQKFQADALGVSVLAHGDGSWDLELEVQREVAPTVQDVRIENTGPRLVLSCPSGGGWLKGRG